MPKRVMPNVRRNWCPWQAATKPMRPAGPAMDWSIRRRSILLARPIRSPLLPANIPYWQFLAALLPVFLLAWLPEEPDEPFQAWMGWTFGGFVILLVGVLPWVLWRMKAYQHRNYALGPLQTDFRAGLGAFYGLALKPLVLVLVVAGLVGLMAGWRSGDVLPMALGGFLAFFPFVLLLLVLAVVPWWKARLQNLVWTKTGNAQIRFISRLSFRSMLWLTIKNWVLVAITLGLYWPFAAVAMARLRLEAIHVRSVVDLENLLALDQQRPEEAAGEAAGDFFGLDVGI